MIFLANIKHCVFLSAQKNRLNEMVLFCNHNIFFFSPILKMCFGCSKGRLIETVLLSTHNICFGWELNGENGFPTGALIWKPE